MCVFCIIQLIYSYKASIPLRRNLKPHEYAQSLHINALDSVLK